jgi:hypothetical protein
MPARSKVTRLPKDVREELDRRIVGGGFAGYEGLAEWLAGQGYEIGRCAVQRHGARLEERLQAIKIATEQARAIVDVSPDHEGAMSDALMSLIQERYFQLIVTLNEDDAADPELLKKISVPIADMVRASVRQKQMMQQVRERLASQLKTAGEKVAAAASEGGLSPEAEKKIREALLDIRV